MTDSEKYSEPFFRGYKRGLKEARLCVIDSFDKIAGDDNRKILHDLIDQIKTLEKSGPDTDPSPTFERVYK